VRADVQARKQRIRQGWSAGDFSKLAVCQTPISDRLVEAADVRPGERVLDVACGSGNTSLAAARRWAAVTGIDFTPHLLDVARRRFEVEGFTGTFLEGDADDLPFPDGSFDVVLSSFGAMFAPDQEKAAGELLRVCRPGGRIGMVNWGPGSWGGRMAALSARYQPPPPPGAHSPLGWGTEERLRELFGNRVSDLRTATRQFVVWYPSVEQWLEHIRRYSPGASMTLSTLSPEQGESYLRELADFARETNQADDGRLAFRYDYVEVVAVRA